MLYLKIHSYAQLYAVKIGHRFDKLCGYLSCIIFYEKQMYDYNPSLNVPMGECVYIIQCLCKCKYYSSMT